MEFGGDRLEIVEATLDFSRIDESVDREDERIGMFDSRLDSRHNVSHRGHETFFDVGDESVARCVMLGIIGKHEVDAFATEHALVEEISHCAFREFDILVH